MYTTTRTLSSAHTFLTKFLFPPLWIGTFAFFTASFFLWPESWHGDTDIKWFFLFGTPPASAVIWWFCSRLKRVRIDDMMLYISNYSTEITVPLANVADISENRNTQLITIHFHRHTEFGSRIVFMPEVRFRFRSPHPVVQEIRAAVGRATGRAPDGVAA